jgi:hypothetical protein
MTDIDRLHKVVELGSWNFRRNGRTFAACHNAAGLLATTPPGSTIVWVLPKMQWIEHIGPMLQQVLVKHLIRPRRIFRHKIEFEDDRVLYFISVDRLEEWMMGRNPYIVDDLGEALENMTPRQEKAYQYFCHQ